MPANLNDFDRSVPLPSGLTISGIKRAIDYIETSLSELVDVYLEQANVFSALAGIYGVKALDSFSVYEKSRHSYTAQQRFPYLRKRGTPDPVHPDFALESKGSKRAWALQSHYNHPGWYVVWRYLVDLTESIEPDRPVIIWRVDVARLKEHDWKYEASTAGIGRGGRTHTFGLIKPAKKLANSAVYARSGLVLRDGKPIPANGSP
jgi:hypothetical protein